VVVELLLIVMDFHQSLSLRRWLKRGILITCGQNVLGSYLFYCKAAVCIIFFTLSERIHLLAIMFMVCARFLKVFILFATVVVVLSGFYILRLSLLSIAKINPVLSLVHFYLLGCLVKFLARIV